MFERMLVRITTLSAAWLSVKKKQFGKAMERFPLHVFCQSKQWMKGLGTSIPVKHEEAVCHQNGPVNLSFTLRPRGKMTPSTLSGFPLE